MKEKIVKLSAFDRSLLYRCSNDFLNFLIDHSDHKYFEEWIKFISSCEDIEKNLFFAEKEDIISPQLLQVKHAYARGKIGGQKQIVYLAYGARDEMQRRIVETKKKQDEKKKKQEEV